MMTQTVLCSYNGIVFDNKKEWSTDTYSLDETERNRAKWKNQSQNVTYCMIPFI